MKLATVLCACCAVAVAAGCGSTKRSTVASHTIHLGPALAGGFQEPTSVVGITAGTASAVVRDRLGDPMNTIRESGQNCWWYRADQPNSSVDGVAFCMTPAGRVGRITLSVHL